MKEIVIKIPEDMYRAIKDDTYCGVLHLTLYDAVKNGKVLPKGHGELIDARAFLQSIDTNDYDTYQDYSNTFDWIADAETLVEADKGDKE